MCNFRFLIGSVAIIGFFTVVSPVIAAEVTPPLILQMSDGRYYHPASGQIAASQEALFALLGFDASATVSIVTPMVPDAATTTEPTIPSVPPASVPFLLHDAITRAQQQFQAEIDANHAPLKVVTVDDGWRTVEVAIWNKLTDAIAVVNVEKNGVKLKCTSANCADFPHLKVTQSNGVNSAFATNKPDTIVIAVKYPIYTDLTPKQKKKKKYEISNAVYTPYSEQIHTPEMVAFGKDQLDRYVKAVYADLDARHAMSRAFPAQTVTAVIDENLAKSIVAIEHMDQASLKNNPQFALDKLYVTLAANQENTYAYAKSTAGALGMVQFIPSTYKNFSRIRPELGLIADFEDGMRDPYNAIKAQVAYLDDLLASLPAETRLAYGKENEKERVAEYVVAAYNGGPARIKTAIASWDAILDGSAASKKAALASQRKSLESQISSLRKKILAEEDEAVWKPMQTKLAGIRKQLADVIAQQGKATTVKLKAETIDYVLKFRRAMEQLKSSQLASL